MTDSKREFTRSSERIEKLVGRLENTGDPAIRAVAQELLQAVIELHGVALNRILDTVHDLPRGENAMAEIAQDELVSGVLSLHGIHPIDLEKRVADALENVRPYLQSHGGNVELVSIENGEVHLRLRGACGSCGSSTETLKSQVENAIYSVAPEIVAVIAETFPARPQLVSLEPD